MGEALQGEPADDAASRLTVERTSERELAVTRTVAAPAPRVWEAWTRPELFRRWWAPASTGVHIVSHEADVRTGGSYRLRMGHPSLAEPMAFFGRYLEATPPVRLVWTNEEAGGAGQVTTVTLEERDGATRVTLHELYPTAEALDAAMADGSTSCFGETFDQLDAVLAELGAG